MRRLRVYFCWKIQKENYIKYFEFQLALSNPNHPILNLKVPALFYAFTQLENRFLIHDIKPQHHISDTFKTNSIRQIFILLQVFL